MYADSSAALGISQRIGIGKVRHLRTQSLWVQETRVTGRLSYKKVLGTKNPADILTKHVPSDLLNRHLETVRAVVVAGRAESAPELNTVESCIEWYLEDESDEEIVKDKVTEEEISALAEGELPWRSPCRPRGSWRDQLPERAQYRSSARKPSRRQRPAGGRTGNEGAGGRLERQEPGMRIPSDSLVFNLPLVRMTDHLDRHFDASAMAMESWVSRDLGDHAKGEPWGLGLLSYSDRYVSDVKLK